MASAFPKFMNAGSKGPQVALLQTFLWGILHDAKQIGDLVPDGDYGPTTRKFVEILQARNMLTIDGHFGPETRTALMARLGVDFDAIPMRAITCMPEIVGPAPTKKS